MPERNENGPAEGPFSFWLHSLASLAAEFEEKGAKAFQRTHPHPFLILVDGPTRGSDLLDVRTEEKSFPSLKPWERYRFGQHAIEVVKSDRNAFKSRITVGRAKNNDIIIRSPKISKLHAACLPLGGGFSLTDAGSVNGTEVNGVRVRKEETVRLSSGDRIALWRYEFEFVMPESFFQLVQEHS